MKTKAMIFVLATLFLMGLGAPVTAETVLTYADHDPPSGMRVDSAQMWFKLIEEESNGRINLT